MRIIDADELKKKLEAERCDCEVIQIIDDMPTVAETANTKAAAIMQHYGAQHQLIKLCEECGELIQQACKCVDSGQPYSEDFVEELADVRVMIMQFEMLLSPYWRREFNGAVEYKLYRQLDRIANEE